MATACVEHVLAPPHSSKISEQGKNMIREQFLKDWLIGGVSAATGADTSCRAAFMSSWIRAVVSSQTVMRKPPLSALTAPIGLTQAHQKGLESSTCSLSLFVHWFAAETLTAPIGRVKMLMQTQDANARVLSGEVLRYKGILDCFVRVSQEQELLSFWRGNLTNVMRYFPTQAFNFAFKEWHQTQVTSVRP